MTTVPFSDAGADAPPARPARITMIASNAVREPYGELLPAFERRTGHAVSVSWGGTVDIVKRVEGGETADLVIVPAARIDTLIAQRLMASRTDLVRSGVGVAAKAGIPRPDVSSVAALTHTLTAARSIVLSSGPSSLYMPVLFDKLGIAGVVGPKIMQIAPGLGVGATLARGEGEIGFTQVSELMAVAGIQYLGPLPVEVQFVTVFSAGLHARAPAPDAARALMAFLTGPAAAPVLVRHGMEPAGNRESGTGSQDFSRRLFPDP
jgi:molybdate transport system substrate-binding protein